MRESFPLAGAHLGSCGACEGGEESLTHSHHLRVPCSTLIAAKGCLWLYATPWFIYLVDPTNLANDLEHFVAP